MCKFQTCTLSVKVGHTNARSIMEAYIWQLPRGGQQRCFVFVDTLYNFLGLTTYKGLPCEWFQKSLSSWVANFKRLGMLGTHHIHSDHDGAKKLQGKVAFTERCLPTNAMPLAALAAMLVR